MGYFEKFESKVLILSKFTSESKPHKDSRELNLQIRSRNSFAWKESYVLTRLNQNCIVNQFDRDRRIDYYRLSISSREERIMFYL